MCVCVCVCVCALLTSDSPLNRRYKLTTYPLLQMQYSPAGAFETAFVHKSLPETPASIHPDVSNVGESPSVAPGTQLCATDTSTPLAWSTCNSKV